MLVTSVTAALEDIIRTEVGHQHEAVIVVVGITVEKQDLVGSSQVGEDSPLGGSLTSCLPLGGRVGQEVVGTGDEPRQHDDDQ